MPAGGRVTMMIGAGPVMTSPMLVPRERRLVAKGFPEPYTNIAGELHWFTLPELLSSWLYPSIQPLGRLLIGIWLWRAAEDHAIVTMTNKQAESTTPDI